MKLAKEGFSVSQALQPQARTYIQLSFERRSSDMTAGTVDKGSAGQPGRSPTPGGSGHGSPHIHSAIPAVFVVLVVVLGSLLGWYIARRLRLSGRSMLSILIGIEQKPELSEVVLNETTLRDTKWSSLLPIAVDGVSAQERDLWSASGPTTSLSKYASSARSSSKRAPHTGASRTGKVATLDSEPGGLRVAVFIAMPAQRVRQVDEVSYADRKIMAVQSVELCIGTIQASSV